MAKEKRYFWLRLMDDFFDSKRIKKLRKMAGGDTYTIIYLKMQLLSVKRGGILEYTGLEDEFYKEVALDINEDEVNVQTTILFLLSCGLLETSDNITYFLPFVEKNLGSEGASAERMRLYRGRQKASQIESSQCYGEIDTEKEKEIDIDSKKKSYSKDVENCVEAWNSLSEYGISKVTKISKTSTRYKNMVARIKEYGFDSVLEAIDNIKKSTFLQGKANSSKNWKITFDWFVLPNNFPKVLDGNYTDSNQQPQYQQIPHNNGRQ